MVFVVMLGCWAVGLVDCRGCLTGPEAWFFLFRCLGEDRFRFVPRRVVGRSRSCGHGAAGHRSPKCEAGHIETSFMWLRSAHELLAFYQPSTEG